MRVSRDALRAAGAFGLLWLTVEASAADTASTGHCPTAVEIGVFEQPLKLPEGGCASNAEACRAERTKIASKIQHALCTDGKSPAPDSPVVMLTSLIGTVDDLIAPAGLTSEQRFADCHVAKALYTAWPKTIAFDQWVESEKGGREAVLVAARSLEDTARARDAVSALRCDMPVHLACGGDATLELGQPTKGYAAELRRAYTHWIAFLRIGAAAQRELRGADPEVIATRSWWSAFRVGGPPKAQDGSRLQAPFPQSAEELHGAICTSRRLADELIGYHAALGAVLNTLEGVDLERHCSNPGDKKVFGVALSPICHAHAVRRDMEALVPTLRAQGDLNSEFALRAVEKDIRGARDAIRANTIEELRTRWQQAAKSLRESIRSALTDWETAARGAVRQVQRTAEVAVNQAVEDVGQDVATKVGLAVTSGIGPDTQILHRASGYCVLGRFISHPSERLDYELLIGIPAPRVGTTSSASVDAGCFGDRTPTWVLSTGRVFTDVARQPDGRVRVNSAPVNMGERPGKVEDLLRGLGIPEFIEFAPIDGQIARVLVSGNPASETLSLSIEARLVVPWLDAVIGKLDPVPVILSLGPAASKASADPSALVRSAITLIKRQVITRLGAATAFQLDYAGPYVRWRGVTIAGDTEGDWDRGVPRFRTTLDVLNPADANEVWLTSDIELRLVRSDKRWRLETGTPQLALAPEAQLRVESLKRRLRAEAESALASWQPPKELQEAILDAIQSAKLAKAELRNIETRAGAVVRDGVSLHFEWVVPALGTEPLPPLIVHITKNGVEALTWTQSDWEALGKRYLEVQARKLRKYAESALLNACKNLTGRRILGGEIEVVPEDCGVASARETFELRIKGIPTLQRKWIRIEGLRLVGPQGGELKPSLAGGTLSWGESPKFQRIDATHAPIFVSDLLGIPSDLASTMIGAVGVIQDGYFPIRVSFELPFVGRVEDVELRIGLDSSNASIEQLKKALENELHAKLNDTARPMLEQLIGNGVKITKVDTTEMFSASTIQVGGTVPIPGLSSPVYFTWDVPKGLPKFDLNASLQRALIEAALGDLITWLSAATGADITVAVDPTRRPIAVAIDAEVRFAGIGVPMPRLLVSGDGIDVTWPLTIPLTGVQINAGPFAFVDPTIHIDGTKEQEKIGLSGKVTLLSKGIDVLLHMDTDVSLALNGKLRAEHSGRTILLEKLELFRSEGTINFDPAEVTFKNSSGSLFSKILAVKEEGRVSEDLATFGGSVDIFGAHVGRATITIDKSGLVSANGEVNLLIGQLELKLTSQKFPSDIVVNAHGSIGVGDYSLSVTIDASPRGASLRFRIFGIGLTLHARSLDQFTPAMILEAILALFEFNFEDLLKALDGLRSHPEFTLGGQVGDGGCGSKCGTDSGGEQSGDSEGEFAADSEGPEPPAPPIGPEPATTPSEGAAPPAARPRPEAKSSAGTAGEPPAILAQPGQFLTGFLRSDNCVALYWHRDSRLILDGPFSPAVADVVNGGAPLVGFVSSVDFYRNERAWMGGRRGPQSFAFTHAGAEGSTGFVARAPSSPDADVGIVVKPDGNNHRAFAIVLHPTAACDKSSPSKDAVELDLNLVHRVIPGWSVWGWRDGDPEHTLQLGDRFILEAHARRQLGSIVSLPRLEDVSRIALPEPQGAKPSSWVYRYLLEDRSILHFRYASRGMAWPQDSFLAQWWHNGPQPPKATAWWGIPALSTWAAQATLPPDGRASRLTWRDVLALHLATNTLPSHVWPMRESAPRLLGFGVRSARFPNGALWNCDRGGQCTGVRTLRQGLSQHHHIAQQAQAPDSVESASVVHALLTRLETPSPERPTDPQAKAPDHAAPWVWMARVEKLLGRELVVAARSDRASHLEVAEISTSGQGHQCFRVAVAELESYAERVRPVCGSSFSLESGAHIGRWLDRTLTASAASACPSPWLVLKELATDVAPCPTPP